MSTRNIVATLDIDISGFVHAMRRLSLASGALSAFGPFPPEPREFFDGTARQYRAARRTYTRQVRAHRKASR